MPTWDPVGDFDLRIQHSAYHNLIHLLSDDYYVEELVCPVNVWDYVSLPQQ